MLTLLFELLGIPIAGPFESWMLGGLEIGIYSAILGPLCARPNKEQP